MELEHVLPADIEKTSFEIITKELGDRVMDPEKAPIIKRVIHTTADFDYADTLYFSPDAVERAKAAIRAGATIVTDTQMAFSGINKKAAAKFGCEVCCFMSDEDVAREAREQGTTRAHVSMDKAARLDRHTIFAIGNAPTALIRLRELIDEGIEPPAAVIGVPVGFVGAAESKDALTQSGLPGIAALGRKGGSNVAAAIVNAILYHLQGAR